MGSKPVKNQVFLDCMGEPHDRLEDAMDFNKGVRAAEELGKLLRDYEPRNEMFQKKEVCLFYRKVVKTLAKIETEENLSHYLS